MKRSWLPLAAFAIAVMLALPRLQALPEPIFSVSPIVAAKTSLAPTAPVATMLPAYGASAHGVSLAALPDGRIAAAWFAGSREGAADVVIVMSVLAGNAWSTPRPIIDRIEVQRSTGRLIRKLGNPVLWSDPQGMLICGLSAFPTAAGRAVPSTTLRRKMAAPAGVPSRD